MDACATEVKAAAALAADFLSTEIGIPRTEALPYANQFAVLIELFRVAPHPVGSKLNEIKMWFWLTTLSGYFSGWDSGQMAGDAKAVREFASGESASLKVAAAVPTESLWQTKPFRANSAVSKMLAVMFGHGTPLDLVTGQRIDVDKSLAWSNDKEFHHLFPLAYLRSRKITTSEANVVGNIVLLTSKSNIHISSTAPSDYLRALEASAGEDAVRARLESVLVPDEAFRAALEDDYASFLEARGRYLHKIAQQLAGLAGDERRAVPEQEVDFSDVDPTE